MWVLLYQQTSCRPDPEIPLIDLVWALCKFQFAVQKIKNKLWVWHIRTEIIRREGKLSLTKINFGLPRPGDESSAEEDQVEYSNNSLLLGIYHYLLFCLFHTRIENLYNNELSSCKFWVGLWLQVVTSHQVRWVVAILWYLTIKSTELEVNCCVFQKHWFNIYELLHNCK